ncbi:hypothetical protein ACHQM5_024199 [Ranunculus cassubicifolius]
MDLSHISAMTREDILHNISAPFGCESTNHCIAVNRCFSASQTCRFPPLHTFNPPTCKLDTLYLSSSSPFTRADSACEA